MITLNDGEIEPFEIYEIDDDDIIRHGTIKNANCFFNSICYGVSSKFKYSKNKDEDSKVLRELVSEKIKIEYWRNLGDGTISYNKFRKEFRNILNYCANKNKINSDYEILLKKCNIDSSFDTFLNIMSILKDKIDTIIDDSYNEESNIRDSVNYIVKECKVMFNNANEKLGKNMLNKRELNSYIHIIKDTLLSIYIQCELHCFNDFLEYFKNVKNKLNNEYIEIVCDILDIDLFFIDSEYKTIYNNESTVKDRDSIILLYFRDDMHYEILCHDNDGYDKKFIFNSDDLLISKIKEQMSA